MLIVFEGIDGVGKTTQANLLAERLRTAGLAVVLTKEPTSGPHGARLRQSATTGRLTAEEELALFEADRREHVTQLIAPALARGDAVLVDRYYFSTAAYQGARGFDPDEILARNERFAPPPDLLVLLELPVPAALERIRVRGDGAGNQFEQAASLERCAGIFARLERPYLLRLDGGATREQLHARIVDALRERCGLRLPGV